VSGHGNDPRSRATSWPRGFIATPRARVVRERRMARPSWSSRKSSNVSDGGGTERRVGLGEMAVAQRLRERDEFASRAHRVGQRLRHVPREGVDDAPQERAQRALRQPFGQRVHGHEPARV